VLEVFGEYCAVTHFGTHAHNPIVGYASRVCQFVNLVVCVCEYMYVSVCSGVCEFINLVYVYVYMCGCIFMLV